MGVFGWKIFQNDLALDLKEDFLRLYNQNSPASEIRQKIESDYLKDLFPEDEYFYWTALAKCQWDCGILEADVKEKTFALIDKIMADPKDLFAEIGDKDIRALKHEATRLKATLNEVNPKPQNPKPVKRYDPVFKKGDLVAFKKKKNGSSWGGFWVVGENYAVEDIDMGSNAVLLLDVRKSTLPTKKDFRQANLKYKMHFYNEELKLVAVNLLAKEFKKSELEYEYKVVSNIPVYFTLPISTSSSWHDFLETDLITIQYTKAKIKTLNDLVNSCKKVQSALAWPFLIVGVFAFFLIPLSGHLYMYLIEHSPLFGLISSALLVLIYLFVGFVGVGVYKNVLTQTIFLNIPSFKYSSDNITSDIAAGEQNSDLDNPNFVINLYMKIGERCEWGQKIGELTKPEKNLFLNQTIDNEVNNGGFAQFFANSSGNYAEETIDSLREIGANRTADLLKKAIARLPDSKVPLDSAERNQIMLDVIDKPENKWDDLDRQFFASEEDLMSLNKDYIIKNKSSFKDL